jgi:hypothetical protein
MAALLDRQDPANTPPAKEKVYQVVGDAAIPVSKSLGSVWKSRKDLSAKKRERLGLPKAWDTAIRYYHNDQSKHRVETGSGLDRGGIARGIGSNVLLDFAETENIIFANTRTAVAGVYGKNPEVEITPGDPGQEDFAQLSEKLAAAVINKKEAPGVNLKAKAKRALISAFLTNNGWLEVGWNFKNNSSDEAVTTLNDLSQEWAKCKTAKEYEEVEAKLQALDDKVSFLTPSGPFVKFHPAGAVLVDPYSIEEDLSDANWVMIEDWLPTKYVKACYYKDGTNESIFKSTHVMSKDGDGKDAVSDIEQQVNNFSIFDSGRSYTELGYENEEAFNDACVIHCQWVWDKTTRRVYLFNDKDWSWPIWVWEDRYRYTDFFPVERISLVMSPKGGETMGEVGYYLDQQDAINFINAILHSIRHVTGTKYGYDPADMDNEQLEKILFSRGMKAFKVKVPEGKKMEDIFPKSIPHPALQHQQLFDKSQIYQSVDRISIVSDVQRGAQFKTNTTNDAIQQYAGVSETKYDDVIDQVEDFTGRVVYKILQLCWRFMDAETVTALIGQDGAQWSNLDDATIQRMSLRVEGGSTQKPNTQAKRQETLQIGQVLGQFAKISPVVPLILVRMLERAFDDMTVLPEEWEALKQSMMKWWGSPWYTAFRSYQWPTPCPP